MFNKEVIEFNSKIYWIFRRFISTKLNEERLPQLTEFWNCEEHIIHSPDGKIKEYLFLRLIPEAEIVE